MKFEVISLFPEVIESYCAVGIIKRAINKKIIELNLHQLRKYGLGNHKKVDDKPFGGGNGMILRPEPIFKAHREIPKTNKSLTIIFTPRGKLLTQPFIRNELLLSEQIILICGRYEGIDERAMILADHQISLGNFILTGGEIGAMIIIDSLTRLLDGTFNKGDAVHLQDSFGDDNGEIIEFPQYTQPKIFENMEVPPVLLSGDHKKIKIWQEQKKIYKA